ncbi:hypothetical protein HK405_000476, partial [Cladochytrium tenue]
MHALAAVFAAYLENGSIPPPASAAAADAGRKGGDALGAVGRWLADHLAVFWGALRARIVATDGTLQVSALHCAMTLVAAEGKADTARAGRWSFREASLRGVLDAVLAGDAVTDATVGTLVTDYLMPYDDVRLTFYACLAQFLREQRDRGVSVHDARIYSALSRLLPPPKASRNETPRNLLVPKPQPKAAAASEDSSNKNKKNKRNASGDLAPPEVAVRHTRAFSDAWLAFLRADLSAATHTAVLEGLHARVAPFLVDPLRLCDFLVDSFNM